MNEFILQPPTLRCSTAFIHSITQSTFYETFWIRSKDHVIPFIVVIVVAVIIIVTLLMNGIQQSYSQVIIDEIIKHKNTGCIKVACLCPLAVYVIGHHCSINFDMYIRYHFDHFGSISNTTSVWVGCYRTLYYQIILFYLFLHNLLHDPIQCVLIHEYPLLHLHHGIICCTNRISHIWLYRHKYRLSNLLFHNKTIDLVGYSLLDHLFQHFHIIIMIKSRLLTHSFISIIKPITQQ
mmetsp:Transcript_1261/g.2292  ORF Transcript_1261/g.2292 Transcript_1261/m.2292 type:complete len:236 (-) Transcript_1261:640-1347(-)